MSKEPKRNVYVGHRYVPKIMGEWDKAETYEGLSIVTNEGTSYTSKKRVPKGVNILNEEYWVVTGNYNAQIEEYRKDIREVEKEVNKKTDKIYVDSEIERLEQKDENISTQLAKTISEEIYPDMFEGNDSEKLQSAFDFCLQNNRGLILNRMFDITGLDTIMINKLNSKDRTPIMVHGTGGIRKDDGGHIFSSSVSDVGDLFFQNIKFHSIAGSGTIVFDGNKLIRVNSNACSYRGVDHIVYVGDERSYIQSYRFKGDYVVGGEGFAYDVVGAYDVTFDDVLVEHRYGGGFRQRQRTTQSNHYSLYNVRFINIVWEGMKGVAIEFNGTIYHSKVTGAYFEGNVGGNVVFHPEATVNSFEISGSFYQGSEETEMIKWPKKPLYCTSMNNVCSVGPIHNTSAVNPKFYIRSINDSIISDNDPSITTYTPQLIEDKTSFYGVQPYNSRILNLGGYMKREEKSSDNRIDIPSNSTATLKLTFTDDIQNDDMISVQYQVVDDKFVSYYARPDNTNRNQLNIYLHNPNTSTVQAHYFRATILKFFKSTNTSR